MPPALAPAGYKLLDPGRYQPLNDDFTAQIIAFKAAGCEIVTGNMIPPDFVTFWGQAAQQGFKPKIVTIGKALLFPSVTEFARRPADGLSTEIWWTPNHPFKSSLTGQIGEGADRRLCEATKRPGPSRSASSTRSSRSSLDVIKRTADLDDNAAILDAITTTDLQTIVGPIKWAGLPVKNVSKTPLVAGQWQKTGKGFDLVICQNKTAPEIPVGGQLKLLSDGLARRSAPPHVPTPRVQAMPILRLRQVTKRYGAIVVADALDLELEEGEALGIIGPNGAGKT